MLDVLLVVVEVELEVVLFLSGTVVPEVRALSSMFLCNVTGCLGFSTFLFIIILILLFTFVEFVFELWVFLSTAEVLPLVFSAPVFIVVVLLTILLP